MKKKNSQTSGNSSIERRNFLKLSLTGLAGGLATGCLPSHTAPGEAKEAQTGQADKTPKVKDDLINPAQVPVETWQEPWIWRPDDWPDQRLELNVVRSQNSGASPSPAALGGILFSFGGVTPGPTVRLRNISEWKLTLRNTLGLNRGEVDVGPTAALFDIPPHLRQAICDESREQLLELRPENPEFCPRAFFLPEQARKLLGNKTLPNWHIGGHLNGFHSTHTTNLHTHGLHVEPQKNSDGSHSDNIFLRVIPHADYQMRQANQKSGEALLNKHEHVGTLNYDIRLACKRDGKTLPHPPGTHWYHPHSHGSTHNQVSSGMAGFLIVEGDVDDAINQVMTGTKTINPEEKTGQWDYRERLIMLQRIFVISADSDAGQKHNNLRFPPFPAINGVAKPPLLKMRPGAVERWRVINGSVDGAGTKRLMVLEGQYVVEQNKIWRVLNEEVGDGDNSVTQRKLIEVSEQQLEQAKLNLQQLSVDGMTLVVEENGRAVHRIRDLGKRNAGVDNPMASPPRPGETAAQTQLRRIESCFRSGESLRAALIRPNEVLMTNANRSDLFFKVPVDAAGKVYTLFAMESQLHVDTHQNNAQMAVASDQPRIRRPTLDVALAYIHVAGKPVEGGDFDIQSLNAVLPPVPPLLQPVSEDELRIPAAEAKKTGAAAGSRRTRTIAYTGTGPTDFPIIPLPPGFAEQHSDLKHKLWTENDGIQIVMPNNTATMGINCEFDLRTNPEPQPARKFTPFDEPRSKMLLNTAEEWVVYNCSVTLWSHTDTERYPQPGSYDFRYIAYPISRAEGQKRFAADNEFQMSVKANDHPFHIHINPMWVIRIDVPDEQGELHNVLPEPCWMDTVPVPRNGGRVIFRSRFEDFAGHWIHHCHVLSHEDNGMMQMIECVTEPQKANYKTREQAASHGMSSAEVDALYPKPSLELMYRQSLSFYDPSPLGSYHYPGFDLEVPKLVD